MRRLTPPTPTLSEAQRRAIVLADEHRWTIAAEPTDGTPVQLRRGHPARRLIVLLAGELPPADYTEGA